MVSLGFSCLQDSRAGKTAAAGPAILTLNAIFKVWM
jgi:hypothetical protein